MSIEPVKSKVAISYGGFTLDATNWITVLGEYTRAEDWAAWTRTGNFYVEIDCTMPASSVTGDDSVDDPAFEAKLAALEAALTLPRQTLLVTWLGTTTILDWAFSPGTGEHQSALGIRAKLVEIENSTRSVRYGFRVTCDFPGNIPSNNFRRESSTQFTLGLAQRRICTIAAEWSAGNAATGSGNVKTARDNYTSFGDAFYAAALPSNLTDQYGTTGAWIKAYETDGPWDDEIARIHVTRVYWECFNGRQNSEIEVDTVPVGGAIGTSRWDTRRICRIPSVWASDGSNTALQNYLAHGPTVFASMLPANVSGGEWVLVDANPTLSDLDPDGGRGVLHVTHTYHEPINGLWEYSAKLTSNEYNIGTVLVAGRYYKTSGGSAGANYTAGISGLVSTVVSSFGVTHVDATSIPRAVGYTTTGLTYDFSHTVHEIAYPQNDSGYDDSNVLLETIALRHLRPFNPMSQTSGITVERMNTVRAVFSAKINAQANTNPETLWSGSLRAHVITQILAKLGSSVTSVLVIDEDVRPTIGDQVNQLDGTLELVVTGGSVLAMKLKQRVTEQTARRFVGRADGTIDSDYPYRRAFSDNDFRKVLERWGFVMYVVGGAGTPPTLFNTGDLTVSGVNYVDPGINAQDSLDAQAATGTLTGAPGWFCLKRVKDDEADDWGDGASSYQTNTVTEYQAWGYLNALEPGTSI